MTTCTCDNCGFTCDEADLTRPLSETPDLKLRLDAGSTVPAGECPECRSFTYLNPTTYTVLLLRPDYIADEFGKDTYLAHITADNATEALDVARIEACLADGGEPEDQPDYACLLIIAGTHNDLNPEL